MKEVLRIAKHVEAQGVNITRTKKGLLLRMPDGESTMLHFTTSDVKAVDNLRSTLHRSGVTMPNDRHDLDAIPAYARHNPSPETLRRVRILLKDFGHPQVVHPAELIVAYNQKFGTSSGANATVMSGIHHLGYYPQLSPAQIKRGGTGRRMYRTWERDYTPEELAELVPVEPEPEPTPPPTLRIVPGEPDPAPEAAEPEPERQERSSREFIDSEESWTVALDAMDPTWTIGQVLALYEATQLNVELRVWHAAV